MSRMPCGPPMPFSRLRCAKKRFEYSMAPNWMETQTPIPRRGVRVPYDMGLHLSLEGHGLMTHLVEGKGSLVLQNTSCTVKHAAIGSFRGSLHPLYFLLSSSLSRSVNAY